MGPSSASWTWRRTLLPLCSAGAQSGQRARQESEARLSAFTRATNDALYQMSADWSVMFQLSGRNVLEDTNSADPNWLAKYIHPLDQPMVLAAIEVAISTKTNFELEHRVRRTDGTLGWTFSRANPVFDDAGKIKYWIGAAKDITDRKAVESALRQTEKLAAVGQLASTIAHEINNPLESLTNLLFLATKVSTERAVLDYLHTAEIELRRVAAITSKTLSFNKQTSAPTKVKAGGLFADTLNTFQGRIRNSNVEVRVDDRATRSFECMEGEIRQVLNNLVGNANAAP